MSNLYNASKKYEEDFAEKEETSIEDVEPNYPME